MVTYNDILRQAALIVNALDATTPGALETVYTTVPLTAALVDNSAVFPFSALKDKVLSAQEALVLAIATTSNHPWRSALYDITAVLASGDLIPATGSTGNTIVGAYGAVREVTTGTVCTRKTIEQIRDRLANPTLWKIPVFWWAMDDGRIYHTCPAGVAIDVCVYERPIASSLNLGSAVLLPDVLAPAYVAGTVAECVRDDEYIEQAAFYAAKLEAWLAAIKSGLTSVIPKTPAIVEKSSQ